VRGFRIAFALAVLAWNVPAAAASLTLTDDQKRHALHAGERSITQEQDVFDNEWQVTNDSGARVKVITPFYRLAEAARQAAFKNEPMKPGEPDKLLREQQDRLIVWAYLRGKGPDFARFFVPRLQMPDGFELEPIKVQNERTAKRQDDGTYLARCVYWFPSKEISGTSRVVLIVRDFDGNDVTRLAIDLGKMR